jgi:hypothetical protein
MEIKRLELLVRSVEPDGTETHIAIHAEYEPAPVQSDILEHCRKYQPAIYRLVEKVCGAPYERH